MATCTTHWTRGASVCDNRLTISEKKATTSILAKLAEVLADPETIAEIVVAFEKRLAEASDRGDEVRDLAHQVAEHQKQVRQLSENLALMPLSEALRGLLGEREIELGRLRLRLAQVQGTGRVLPHPNAVRHYVAQLAAVLQADDQARAKTLLREHVGQLTFTPRGKHYEWTGGLLFGLSVSSTPAEGFSTGVLSRLGSGGRIRAPKLPPRSDQAHLRSPPQ